MEITARQDPANPAEPQCITVYIPTFPPAPLSFSSQLSLPFGLGQYHLPTHCITNTMTNNHSRSSVVSVLFSLISETSLRRHSRLFLFLDFVGIPLGLLMYPGTVSPVLHCLGLTRTLFTFSSVCCGSLPWPGEEDCELSVVTPYLFVAFVTVVNPRVHSCAFVRCHPPSCLVCLRL